MSFADLSGWCYTFLPSTFLFLHSSYAANDLLETMNAIVDAIDSSSELESVLSSSKAWYLLLDVKGSFAGRFHFFV